VPGTPAWCALPDGGPKLAAVLLLGVQYALLLDSQQEARAEASRAVAGAADWPKISREINQLNAFYTERPWLRRVTS
jgi:Protein of unknown function (DUF2742)